MSDFPPIASLRSFEAVARLGSVTLAASRRSHTALPRRAGCTQKSKESMAVRTPDQRGAPPLRSAKSHAQVAAFCGFIGVGRTTLFVI